MVKAIFFDIDGTLISFRTHTIPESTREALKRLREKGIKIFIATGRPRLLLSCLEDIKFDGYITLNGAHCFTENHQDIYKSTIPAEDVERLIHYYQTHPFPFVFVHDDQWFITHVTQEVEDASRLVNIPPPPIAPIERARNKDILQIMGYFTEKDNAEIFGNVLTHCEPMRWNPAFADVIARGNSKSHGIDRVIARYGIDLKDTMAFGDGGNDIPMLKHVATGIAMGNAAEPVRDMADYITDSVDEDGIINALTHFGILD